MILHLSAQQTGGAAIAALRIHEALLEAGLDSRFLAGSGMSDPSRKIDVVPRFYGRFWQRGLQRVGVPANQYRKWQRLRKKYDLPKTVLSGIRSDIRLSEHPSVKAAQIIHLHWVTGMFDWPDLFAQVRKPIVWTLHDMNPFLGIFHYDGDREMASRGAQALDRKVQLQKAQLIHKYRDVLCVAPSKWLSDRAKNSDVLREFEHHVIRNPLDTAVFHPFPREYGRDIFGLPRDRKILLVIAERLDNFRKGMDLFTAAVAQCELGPDWEIVAVGAGGVEGGNEIRQLGSIANARLLALLYSTADLFVIPSRQDNLPNTVLESLSCGTPVVGFPAGGIPEAVEEPRDGVIATEIDAGALTIALKKAVRSSFDRAAIRQNALQRFNGNAIARQYADIYAKLN